MRLDTTLALSLLDKNLVALKIVCFLNFSTLTCHVSSFFPAVCNMYRSLNKDVIAPFRFRFLAQSSGGVRHLTMPVNKTIVDTGSAPHSSARWASMAGSSTSRPH